MTTVTITDISNKIIPKSKYTSEELVKILFNQLDYKVELESFSKKENDLLLSSNNDRYEKFSELID